MFRCCVVSCVVFCESSVCRLMICALNECISNTNYELMKQLLHSFFCLCVFSFTLSNVVNFRRRLSVSVFCVSIVLTKNRRKCLLFLCRLSFIVGVLRMPNFVHHSLNVRNGHVHRTKCVDGRQLHSFAMNALIRTIFSIQ